MAAPWQGQMKQKKTKQSFHFGLATLPRADPRHLRTQPHSTPLHFIAPPFLLSTTASAYPHATIFFNFLQTLRSSLSRLLRSDAAAAPFHDTRSHKKMCLHKSPGHLRSLRGSCVARALYFLSAPSGRPPSPAPPRGRPPGRALAGHRGILCFI